MKEERRFVHSDFIQNEYEHSEVYYYLDKYITEDVYNVKVEPINTDIKYNKTIWMLWLQGRDNAPMLVQECIDSVMRNKPDDFDMILLTEENISDFISLPQYIVNKYDAGLITRTHLSDIIRIELLCIYGGCWIDTTVYCAEKIPEYMLSGDLFMFKGDITGINTVLKMSSWWMFAVRKNFLINATRNILFSYWEKENELRDYFLLHLIMSKLIDESTMCAALYRRIPYFSNSNCHVLFGMLGMKYDCKQWELVKKASIVQKLSYKRKYLQGDLYTFYTALINRDLIND